MIDFFMVLFREGLEALLIVAITVAFLKQLGLERLLPTAYAGMISAILFSIVLGIVFAWIGAMSPLWEGVLALVSAGLILSCTVHMFRMGPKMGSQIREQLLCLTHTNTALSKTSLFLFIFLMIAREGIESTTLIASLAQEANPQRMLIGCFLGLGAAFGVAYLWMRYGRRINLSLLFNASAIFMSLFFIQLVIYGIHELSEAGVVPWVNNLQLHVLTEPYGPEGEIGTWISLAIVAIPMLYVIYSSIVKTKKVITTQ